MKQIVLLVVFMIISIMTLNGQNSPLLINYQGFLTDSDNIQVNGIRKHLGRFIDINDAIAAYVTASIKNGFHENHGS